MALDVGFVKIIPRFSRLLIYIADEDTYGLP